MSKKNKKILIMLSVVIMVIAVLLIIYHVSQKETYLSDDPLYGSFTIENKQPADPIYPTDFLLSIDVDTKHESLVKCAKESDVDISKGCWVYSFDENKIFRAEKEGNKLHAYEDGKVIGTFKYSFNKILWIHYDEKYTANWRGTEVDLTRAVQGCVFP